MLEIPCHKKVDPMHGRKSDMHRVRGSNRRDETGGNQDPCQISGFTGHRKHPKPVQQGDPFPRHLGIAFPGFIQCLG